MKLEGIILEVMLRHKRRHILMGTIENEVMDTHCICNALQELNTLGTLFGKEIVKHFRSECLGRIHLALTHLNEQKFLEMGDLRGYKTFRITPSGLRELDLLIIRKKI